MEKPNGFAIFLSAYCIYPFFVHGFANASINKEETGDILCS